MVKTLTLFSLGGLFSTLSALTVFWPDWLEEFAGADPDLGSGALERGIAVILAILAVTLIKQALRAGKQAAAGVSTRAVLGR